MEKVKFGIIGVGNMGTSHLGFLTRGEVKNGVCTVPCGVSNMPRRARPWVAMIFNMGLFLSGVL